MGRQKNSNALFAPQIRDDIPEQAACLRIQAGRRFIQNQDFRPVQQCACDIDPAPLTAGELPDRPIQEVFKVQQLCQLREAVFECFSADAVQRCSARQIIPHGQRLIQHRRLKNDAELAADFRHTVVNRMAADLDFAAVFGQLSAEDGDRR